MRILHCIPSFGSGGAERQCLALCSELSQRGHEVHVAYVLPGVTDYVRRLQQAGVRLHWLGEGLPQDIWRAQKSPRVLWRLLRTVRSVRPAIVQSWNRPMDTFCGVAGRLTRFPWVLSERSSGALYADRREVVRVWAARRAAAIVANSEGGAAYWRARVPAAVRIQWIPNMVDAQKLGEDGTEVPWPADCPPHRTVFFAGRFSAEKNTRVMIESLRIASQRCELHAILCGTGVELQQARDQIAACGLQDRVRFMGFVQQPWQWMKRAAMTLSVSLCEGHPNVVTEAMAVGCPLVVSDIPAHRALLGPQEAYLVPADAPSAIADAIVDCLSDRSRAMEHAHCARQVVSRWHPHAIAASYEQLYQELATSKPAGRHR